MGADESESIVIHNFNAEASFAPFVNLVFRFLGFRSTLEGSKQVGKDVM